MAMGGQIQSGGELGDACRAHVKYTLRVPLYWRQREGETSRVCIYSLGFAGKLYSSRLPHVHATLQYPSDYGTPTENSQTDGLSHTTCAARQATVSQLT